MTSIRLLVALLAALVVAQGCGQKGGDNNGGAGGAPEIGNLPNGHTLPPLSGANVMPMTVNGSLCTNSSSYPNKPCASVTICAPGTTNCQTINDILVDTGSFGLRVFTQVVTVPLTQVSASTGKPLAECAQFGSGSDWGPVKLADVVLGGEPAVQVPIQVIDSTFAKYPSSCGTPDVSPSSSGFKGILGVGLFGPDCGATCTSATNGTYYSCNGTTCTNVAVATASQVTNPVSALPQDNNGVIVELPSVPSGGASSASGYLVLGIGTQTNNKPSGVTAYGADKYGELTTSWDGKGNGAFFDSGSNGLFFPPPKSGVLPDCGGSLAGWYCPSATQQFTATDTAASGSPSVVVPFLIGNTSAILGTGNNVYMELGASTGGASSFDWGMPFHLGRNVYVGIEGRTSSLGTGPYWAF